ncbi:alanine racemase [Metallumcola ferriviriculae]|uniref:Alanine racemase n=1 Tax=Metallumcola ferriviriculae TaxID=3039180 RepID=A0AAU0USF1_9FIRM|nr:alanine racemase [Desulfitibacteraceae bacterium MK1]
MLRPVWAEIDLGAIKNNIREIRRITSPQAQVMAVVKANAYGHGANEVSEVALKNGAQWLGVALLQEAIQLRNTGIDAPILILGYTPLTQLPAVVDWDLRQTIYSLEQAKSLSTAALSRGKKAKAHVKLDTGMGRIGLLPEEVSLKTILEMARLPGLELEGIYTHFAVADAADKRYTAKQLQWFSWFLDRLKQLGLEFLLRHAANSAAVIDLPEAHFDLVRPGLIIYGLYPSKEVKRERIDLRQAMALKAELSYVKKVGAGTAISYGCTYITKDDAVIASLPLGYADGYTRLLSNRAEVLIQGRRVPMVGRVCMDQCMVDVTDIKSAVSMGDEAVLIGGQGDEFISVEELADQIGTISYEVVCMISYRVPRIYR